MERIQKWRKFLSVLVCAAIVGMAFAPSASAQQTGNIIIDVESGETAEELMSEDTPVWASQQVAVPTDAKALDVGGKSAVLMELSSGQVLFEKNSH